MIKWVFPLKWLLFSLSYLSLAFICLQTRDNGSLSSSIWLPAGLTLGVLCTTSVSRWPIWLVSAGILHVFASYLHDRPMDIALIFAINDLIILCVNAMIWQSVIKGSARVNNLTAMTIFISIVLGTSAVGGMINVYLLRLLSYPIVFSHFTSSSISNATGCLAMAPLFVVNQLSQLSVNKRTNGRSLLLMSSILILSVAIFLPESDFDQSVPAIEFSLYLLFGMTLLSSLFINEKKLSFLYVALALIISITTIYHRGPFSADYYDNGSGITASQLYLLAIFISGLLVRSGITDIYFEKKQSDQQLLLAYSATPTQSHYQFKINVTLQKIIWSDPASQLINFPSDLLATPAQLLGRMTPDDRMIFTPWFDGTNKTAATPFSQSLSLVLTDSTFVDTHIALLCDHDNTANTYVNGVLIVYQNNLSQTGR